jgi:hypothetical protein
LEEVPALHHSNLRQADQDRWVRRELRGRGVRSIYRHKLDDSELNHEARFRDTTYTT